MKEGRKEGRDLVGVGGGQWGTQAGRDKGVRTSGLGSTKIAKGGRKEGEKEGRRR